MLAKGVGFTIFITFMVDNFEVKFYKEFVLSYLPFVKVLCYYKGYEVLIVRVNFDLSYSSAKVVLLFPEGFDNSYELLIIDRVIKF